MSAPAPTTTPTLAQIAARFFPGTTPGLTFGAADVTGYPHNGQDFIGPAYTQINLPTRATFRVSEGNQAVFQTASGQFLSFLHILPAANLVPGQSYGEGTQVGLISPISGTAANPRYTVGGYTYFSTTPHLHFAVTPSLATALSDTQGSNPVSFLDQAFGSSQSGGQQGPGGQPFIIGGLGDIFGQAGNAINSAGNAISGTGTVSYGQAGNAINSAGNFLDSHGNVSYSQALGWLGVSGATAQKWVVLVIVALAGLVVLAALVRGPSTSIVKEVPHVPA